MDIKGCVALVTGGTRGLGRATAVELTTSELALFLEGSRAIGRVALSPAVFVPRPRLSVVGGIQPEVLDQLRAGPADGLRRQLDLLLTAAARRASSSARHPGTTSRLDASAM